MYYDNKCETCDREFGSQQAAIQHMDALDHWGPRFECDTCDREFFTQHSAEQHMDDTGHWELQYECETCDRRFHSEPSANQHMSALKHHKQHYCRDCAKTFRNENALKMLAGFHTTLRPVHVRELEISTIVRSFRPSVSGIAVACSGTQDIATGATWNGFNHECYLCHRDFSTLQGLNQHLNSPAHSGKLYHCPNRSCAGQFVRLASLFNHLESESCNFVRFEKVQKHVHDFITGRQKLLGFG
ncbi:zinc finger protein [Stemphylium lycopersici]|uniref:Zinc finger protein n=1 Tax=Stemphylium lycopersici TaxID=183478 RepID=A0A364NDZ3_STELY|nr:zinc finger protein [Stemphylium lycopersici]